LYHHVQRAPLYLILFVPAAFAYVGAWQTANEVFLCVKLLFAGTVLFLQKKVPVNAVATSPPRHRNWRALADPHLFASPVTIWLGTLSNDADIVLNVGYAGRAPSRFSCGLFLEKGVYVAGQGNGPVVGIDLDMICVQFRIANQSCFDRLLDVFHINTRFDRDVVGNSIDAMQNPDRIGRRGPLVFVIYLSGQGYPSIFHFGFDTVGVSKTRVSFTSKHRAAQFP